MAGGEDAICRPDDVQLVSENTSEQPTSIVVPAVAFRFFVDVLTELANSNAFTVAPAYAELTSQQAADILNVSRPYLIKLLDDDKIPYRRVGNRRKILLTHLLEYKRRDEALRRHRGRWAAEEKLSYPPCRLQFDEQIWLAEQGVVGSRRCEPGGP